MTSITFPSQQKWMTQFQVLVPECKCESDITLKIEDKRFHGLCINDSNEWKREVMCEWDM